MTDHTLIQTVLDLKASYDESNQLSAMTLVRLEAIADRLDKTPTNEEVEKKAEEVKRRNDRIITVVASCLAAVVVVAVLVGWSFRSQDQRRGAQDKTNAREIAAVTHQTLINGCERANDQRTTLREIITLAVADVAVPMDATEDVAEQVRVRNLNATALRVRLLNLSGVQPVNCPAAFPAIPEPDESSGPSGVVKVALQLLAVLSVVGLIVVAWLYALLGKKRPKMTDDDAEIWNGRERRSTPR